MDLSALRAAVAEAPAVVAVGAQTQWELGGPVTGAKEVRAPAGVVDYEPEDMTVTVGAGTSVTEIGRVLGEHGQECPLDPRDPSATVGGVLASGLSGVRRLRHGPIRDQVLEVRFVTGDARVVKGGGPTVKNVTGYDLPRLMVGSFGTLGVLAQVTLRCRPRAQVAKWFATTEPPVHAYRPAAMLWTDAGVFMRCEGNATDVDAQGAGLDECEAPALPEGAHRGRISVAPNAMSALVADLERHDDLRWCAELGIGTIHIATDTAGALQRARECAHARDGWLLRETGGDGMDPFGRELPNRALMSRIKAAFDPTGKLAPGRLPCEPAGGRMKPLGLDDDELVACVACGLCLPHCPTYRVTGLEIASPRGRIAAMRAVDQRGAAIDDTFLRAMDECVQCRGCEAACPSGVQFGHLMEDTRAALRTQGRSADARSAPEWFAYTLLLPRHWLLLAATWLLVAAQKLHLVPRRFGLPRISSRSLRPLAVAVGGRPDAWLFTGCVMDAWMRDTHRSTARLMRAAGARIARPPAHGSCCGALHVHAGRADEARKLARRVIASMPGAAPIVVNSAGCGASMKEYGHLLGTPEAHAFAARVEDFSEWLVAVGVPPTRAQHRTVVVQDPCHLRHVQKAHTAVRTALGPAFAVRDTDDEGLCCGAGGAYAVSQPELASRIRDRKVDALYRAGAGAPGAIVASANPGCMMHLRAAGIDARHPADLLAEALDE